MFCGNCGKPTENTTGLCDECAMQLNAQQPAETAPMPEETPVPAGGIEEPTIPTTDDNEKTIGFDSDFAVAPVFNEAPQAAAPIPEQPLYSETPVAEMPTAEAPMQDGQVYYAEPVPQKKSKKKGAIITGSVIAGVAAIALVVVLLLETFLQALAPAGWYCRRVLKNEAKKGTEVVSESVDSVTDLIDGGSVTGSYDIKLSNKAADLLQELAGVEVENCKIGMNYDLQFEKKKASLDLSVLLDGKEFCSGKAVWEKESGLIYLSTTGLGLDNICIDVDALLKEADAEYTYKELYEAVSQIYDAIPKGKVFESVLNKALFAAIAEIDDVKKSTETLEAGDVSQKCKCYTATLDADTIGDMAEAALKEIRNNKDIKKVVRDLADVDLLKDQLNADKWYKNYCNALDDAIDSIDSLEDEIGNTKIKVGLYVNKKAEIIGLDVAVDGTTYFKGAFVEKGKKFGCSVKVRGIEILSGGGTVKNGKYTGEMTVGLMGQNYLTIGLNDFKAEEDEISGEIWFAPEEALIDALEDGADIDLGEYASMIENAKIVVSLDCNDKEAKESLQLKFGGMELFSMTMSAKIGNKGKVTVPKNCEKIRSADELEEWASDIDTAGLTEKIQSSMLGQILQGVMASQKIDYDDYDLDDYDLDDYDLDDYDLDDYDLDDYDLDDYDLDDYDLDDYGDYDLDDYDLF